MSFSLIGPFSFGAKVTSTQFNQLDSDHANALDKSVAGDSIAGTIGFTGAGNISANTNGAIGVNAIGGLQVNTGSGLLSLVNSGIVSQASKGITTTAAGGIAPSSGGTITDGGIAGGIQGTIAGGIQGTIAGAIRPTTAGGIDDGGTAGGIAITTAGGLKSNTGGGNGIKLVGSTEWIDYQVSRLVTRTIWLGGGGSPATGWTAGTVLYPSFIGPGTNAHDQVVALNRMIDGNFNGSTLVGATLVYAITVGRASLPTLPPRFQIDRLNINAGGNPNVVQSLYSGGAQILPTGGSVGAYESSGNLQQLATTPNQNNFVDLNNYLYVLSITDEQGGGAIGGNTFIGIKLEFGSIVNSGL